MLCSEPALRYSPQANSSINLQKFESDLLSTSAALRSSALSLSSKRTVMKSFGRFTGFFPSPKIVEQLHHRYILDACQVFCIYPIRILGPRRYPSYFSTSHYVPSAQALESTNMVRPVRKLWRTGISSGTYWKTDSRGKV
jgi:hypothetical protein